MRCPAEGIILLHARRPHFLLHPSHHPAPTSSLLHSTSQSVRREMAEGASIQSRGARYFDARVLLLSWEVADKRFDEELGHLERTFKDAYNFSTCRYKIP